MLYFPTRGIPFYNVHFGLINLSNDRHDRGAFGNQNRKEFGHILIAADVLV